MTDPRSKNISLRGRRAAGLTFVELCVALAITGVIGVAVCSFTFATGTAWRGHEAGRTAEQLAHVAATRINRTVQTARLFGAWTAGDLNSTNPVPPAAVIVWTADKNLDGKIQTSEIVLIEYEAANKRLVTWSRPAPKIDETWTWAEFSGASAFDTMHFRSDRAPMVSNLVGAQFRIANPGGSTARPTLEYQLKTDVAGRAESFSGAASIRAPSETPQ